ncbi:MAG: endonuclease domain-containing protein [Chloroflexota bacterium]|nr:endonuclease domain-containing protein [Chloroflexota bacterium]
MPKPLPEHMKTYSRQLRKNMTKQEKYLWYDFLRTAEFQFHRQRVIDKFIVDFSCAKAKLIIEIDGWQHFEDEMAKKDAIRDKRLNDLGYQILRFTNKDIDQGFLRVCEIIRETVEERVHFLNTEPD